MTIQSKQGHSTSGEHLRKLVNLGSIGGLLFSLIGTGLVWAGSDSFSCPTIVWKVSLALNLAIFGVTWIVYIPFRNTDLLLGNGLIMTTVLLNMFSTFWIGGFYFYFLFAPINTLLRSVVLISMTATLLHRAYKIRRDIDDAFRKNKKLFNNMYCDEGTSITFKRGAIGLLERYRRERTPFNPPRYTQLLSTIKSMGYSRACGACPAVVALREAHFSTLLPRFCSKFRQLWKVKGLGAGARILVYNEVRSIPLMHMPQFS